MGRQEAFGTGQQSAGGPRRILWIRTAAGPKIGFGHLRRSLILAGMVSGCAQPIFLVDEQDTWSLGQIAHAGWLPAPYALDGSWPELADPDAILIDTRETRGLERFVAEARRRAIPIVSIHDLGLNPLGSDIVIDGSMVPRAKRFPRVDTVFYTGTNYLVLHPSCSEIHGQPKRIRAGVQSVLVSLGGGDTHHVFPKILHGLRAWGKSLEVIGLPGFCDWGQSSLAGQIWEPLSFRWGETGDTVCNLAHGADLAITAGGLSAFEVLCAGTPLLAFSHDRLQEKSVCALAKAGACTPLGLMRNFRPEKLPAIVEMLDANRAARQLLSKRGRAIVDGAGAERVARILLKVIMRSPSLSQEGVQ